MMIIEEQLNTEIAGEPPKIRTEWVEIIINTIKRGLKDQDLTQQLCPRAGETRRTSRLSQRIPRDSITLVKG